MQSRKCKCKQDSFSIKFQADAGADPMWCAICDSNLAIIDFGLSEEFIQELYQWLSKYIEWIDIETDSLVAGAEEMQQRFNEEGLVLCEKFKNIIGDIYTVEYKPANSVSYYRRFNR